MRCARLALSPRVKTGGCSRNQISSGVAASRAPVKRCIARQVGSYSQSPGGGSRAGAASFAPRGARAPQVRRRRESCRETPVVEAGVVALKRALGAIARAHERSGHAFEEAERERALAVAIELLGSHEAPDGQVIHGRAQVLSEGHDVDSGGAQISECLVDLGITLTEP